MHKIAFNLKLCFGLATISLVLSFLYISSLKVYVHNTSKAYNKPQVRNHVAQDDYSMQSAVQNLKDTVGTIPDFTPQYNDECPKFPNIFNLHINNNIWQVLETTNGTFYLFGAYYDDRQKNLNGPSIRIIGMINKLDPVVQTICQLWYKDQKPIEVPANEYLLIWLKAWGVFKTPSTLYPYLITCDIPEEYQQFTPAAVSLVEMPCDLATNNLVVNNYYLPPEKKKEFVVCVKGLNFPFDDVSVRLIEWIELVKLFGADKIVFYNLNSHSNVENMLEYYQSNYSSFVEVKSMTLPGKQLNFGYYQYYYIRNRVVAKRLAELVAYNDCFYRNMYDYKYVVLLDIDEIIVPTLHQNWSDLIQHIQLDIKDTIYSAFSVQNVYFLDKIQNHNKKNQEIPKILHMLQHTIRTKNFTKANYFVKCFHKTEEVVTLHNHFPLVCFTLTSGNHSCNYYSIDNSMAQLNHYREDCSRIPELKKQCPEMKRDSIVDETLWRFADVLVARVRQVADVLGLTLR